MGWVEDTGRDRKPFRGVAWNHVKQAKAGSKSFPTDYEADAWWRAKERDITATYSDAGVDKPRQERDVPTLAEFGRTVLQARDVEQSTRNNDLEVFNRQIAAFWGESTTVRKPDKLAVQRMFNAARDRGNGASRRGQILATYRVVFQAAVDQGYRSDNPTQAITAPQVPRKHARILSAEEISAVQQAMPGWLSAAVLVMAHAGLRVSECCGLQRHNVDEMHGEVIVQHIYADRGKLRNYPKGKEPLPVPMSAALRHALVEHMRTYQHPDNPGYVFFHPKTRGPIRPETMRDWFSKALVAAEIPRPHPTPHDLRHYTATTLARSGAEAYDIQTVLRHTNMATSQRYIDRVPREHRHTVVGVFDRQHGGCDAS